jgi:protein tyrosine/serine phosphatase
VSHVAREAERALALLHGPAGPSRFACVADGIYRGGQPTREQLEALHALGVRTVISLRREQRKLARVEAEHVGGLGMTFLRFPFYGVFGADELFLQGILEHMRRGGVYIHCKHGRDRTSLLIALYRVCCEGWDPERAWQLEVLGYEHSPTYFYRRLRSTFDRYVARHRRLLDA